MRALYTLLWYAALPWLPLRLWWRGRREPGYRVAVGERFGRFGGGAVRDPAGAAPVVWIHAVSLGETHAARPLVERLAERHPHATILLTHMTATGRAAGRTLAGGRVLQAWLPYDLPSFVTAFLRHFQPALGIVLETEVWPNLIAAAAAEGMPLYLVNARLSERSARRYRRVPRLARAAFSGFAGIAAQTTEDAARIAALGAPAPIVTGSLKFDVAIGAEALAAGAALRARLGAARGVWLAASTRDGEEGLLLDAWQAQRNPALLVLVPRHPQRFEAVAALLAERDIRFARRSAGGPVGAGVAVVLGDSMGEMPAYCAAADVVVMGGSFLPLGGQNLIEPLAVGRPTIVGPHMFNFAAVTEAAVAAGAVLQVGDARAAVAAVVDLLDDAGARAAMAAAARDFHARAAGAADRVWDWLTPRLDAALAGQARPEEVSRRGAG